jgi:hypothetical protein
MQCQHPLFHAFVLICLALTGWHMPGAARAQGNQISEYQVKAAFLFNFVKFVEWPSDSFPAAETPIIIGVFGTNPFGGDLDAVIHNKTVNNRPIEIRQLHLMSECTNCHVLFISGMVKKRVGEVLSTVGNASVLTVGESDGFTEAGGIINFVREGNKFRFQINAEAAKKAKLKISSKLLGLALPSNSNH